MKERVRPLSRQRSVRAHHRVVILVLASVLIVATSGCVRHMITPANSSDGYTRKAVATAEAALSAVNTVLLIADAGADGKLFRPYANVSVSEQEDGLDAIQSGFRSIQPPDPEADELREELDAMLTAAITVTSDVRIAMRRGDFDGAAVRAQALEPIADSLESIASSS